jgi:hypothetical protein
VNGRESGATTSPMTEDIPIAVDPFVSPLPLISTFEDSTRCTGSLDRESCARAVECSGSAHVGRLKIPCRLSSAYFVPKSLDSRSGELVALVARRLKL